MSVVHVVHCIDTEGPLEETLEATFGRLKIIFGLDLPPSAETLARLQRQEIDLGGIEADVARVVDPQLLAYNSDWAKVDAMLERVTAPGFRHALPDSFGGGWVYNWLLVDHVGFLANPRNRAFGFHVVWDRYDALVRRQKLGDEIYFHHHPVPFSRAANHCATHLFNHMPLVYEILARKLIERRWFPSSYGPGFHTIRPDSHWFLEQFFPFDLSNQREAEAEALHQRDMVGGRFGDWRRAPASWAPYHPHHDDWQVEGNCRRWTGRCLNIGTRMRLLTQRDVDQAFREAAEGKPVVMGFTCHDFRDFGPEVDGVRTMLASAAARFPQVKFRYSSLRDAFRDALKLAVPAEPLRLDLSVADNTLRIQASRPIFGPQPFLALKTKDGRFLADNLDFQVPSQSWSYVFEDQTIPLENLEAVALGACDPTGAVAVSLWQPGGSVEQLAY